MYLNYQAMERAMQIKQEDEEALGKLDHSYSYVSHDDNCNRIKDEPSIENVEPSDSTVDIKKYIKVEEDMLAIDVKVEEQESETYMYSTRQMLSEELDIKPHCDISNDGKHSAELDRDAMENIREEKYDVVNWKADEGSFICYLCHFTAYSKKDLISHINVGNCRLNGHAKKTLGSLQSKEYGCTKCQKIFKSKQAIDNHVIKNHDKCIVSVSSKIHRCKHCSYKTTLSSSLNRHMAKHPESGCRVQQIPCVHCARIFKSKVALHDHILKNHEEFIACGSFKIHQCKCCSYKTTYLTHLTKHMVKHPETKCIVEQFPCINCDKTFKSKMALHDHILRNHKEFSATVSSRIHQCVHCNYKTTFATGMTRHMRKHHESGYTVERFPCIHCGKTFKVKKALHDHVLKNHQEFSATVSSKIHQCKQCSYKTTSATHMTRHMKKHFRNGCVVK